MSDSKMREEFEAWWIKDQKLSESAAKFWLSTVDTEGYRSTVANEAWHVWKASRATVVIELPNPESKDRPTCVAVAFECCQEAIEAAGLKVKP